MRTVHYAEPINPSLRQCTPTEGVLTLYIDALCDTIRLVVACYRESHLGDTYLDVVDYAQRNRGALRARNLTPQAGRIAKPLQKLQLVDLLQSPGDLDSTSTPSFSNSTIHAEGLK